MKRKGLFWKIIGLISALALTGVFVFLGLKLYDRKYGKYYSRDYAGGNCELISYYDGQVKLYNQNTQKETTPKLDWIASVGNSDTLTVFCKNGKRGFINLVTGKIIIHGQFDRAWIFSEGLAAILINNKLGFINTAGKMVIPFKFTYNPNSNEKIDFLFKGGCCTATGENGKYGLIDKNGNWMLLPEYDYIVNPVKGYRVVRKNDYYGVVDSTQHLVVPLLYKWVKVTGKGFIMVKDNVQYLASFDGVNVIQPFVYDQLDEMHYTSKQVTEDGSDISIRSDYTAFEMHGLWGVMDNKGKVIIPAGYSEINAIANDLFSCKLNDYWITIDSKGNIVF
jgi:hypothetical protein